MAINKRMFTLEFKVEAAHRVIDSGRSVKEVATELSLAEGSLRKWVREERRRIEASQVSDQEPLNAAERLELQIPRHQVAQQAFSRPFRHL